MRQICAKAAAPGILFFALVSFNGVAARTLVLEPQAAQYNPSTSMEYFSSAKRLNLREVRARAEGWRPLTRAFFHHRHTRAEFWFRLKVRNQSDIPRWYFSILSNRLDHVDLYYNRGGKYHVLRDGDWAVWKPNRSAPYPVFTLTPPADKVTVYYLRVQSETMLLSFEPLIAAPREFGARRALEQSLQALALLLLAVYLLYCGAMFYFRRAGAYIFLILLAISFCLYGLTIIGDANLILWVRHPYFRNVLNLVWATGTIFFFLQFAARLLQTRDLFPGLHWLIRILSGACLVFLPLIFTPINNHILSPMVISIQLSSIGVVFIAAVRALLLKRWYVLYFLFSFGMVMTAGAAHTLMLLDVLPYNFLTLYAGYLASPLEFISISAAMAVRYRKLAREKENLLRENIRARATAAMPATTYGDPTLKRVRNLDADQVLEGLRRLAEEEQVFYNERVNLKSVARLLDVRPDQLSAILNSELRTSFNDLVNKYRVEFARSLLSEHPRLNVLEIAFMTGFGSRTNFNRVFKKSTGATPLEYRREHAVES